MQGPSLFPKNFYTQISHFKSFTPLLTLQGAYQRKARDKDCSKSSDAPGKELTQGWLGKANWAYTGRVDKAGFTNTQNR